MERNEVLMLTHQFRDECLEDVFLAYYTNRKFVDLWPENRRPDSAKDFAYYRRREKRNDREKELKEQGMGEDEIEKALEEYDEELKIQQENGTFENSPNTTANVSSNNNLSVMDQNSKPDEPFCLDYLRHPERRTDTKLPKEELPVPVIPKYR